ncbi:MAG: PorV/PorQ family protein, partial [Bacteroidales bacterium]|nr:PorV/PorQ family protein [Bacteroidales bacterium]
MKYNIIATLTAMLTAACLTAAAGDGTAALPFARINHDPVSAAMGGAGVVNASAYSSYRNTAAVTYWDKTFDVAVGYQSKYSDMQNIGLGAAWKISDKVAVTLGGHYGLGDEYEITGDYGSVDGTYKTNEMQINVGAAWKFLPYLSIGADFKYLSNKVSSSSTLSAFAADVFLMTKLSDFRIAAGISNIGTSVKSSSGDSFSLPTSVTVAGGYDHSFGKHGLNVALDLDYYYDTSDFIGALGAEYNYNKIVFVRAGYHYGADEAVIPSYASFGVGVQYFGIHLDFA